MAETLLRDRVRALRFRGLSLNELSRRFGIPKSTARYWCRDIVLSKAQQRRLFDRQRLGGILAAEQMRRQRLILTQRLAREGAREIGPISHRDLLLIGVALYWAEGYRKGDGNFGFTNSDPRMIALMVRWLEAVGGATRQLIRPRVCINNAHHRRLAAAHRFWSRCTGIPVAQFAKPTLIHSVTKKRYLNPSEYFGTLRLTVRRSTNLRRKIMGWIAGIAK